MTESILDLVERAYAENWSELDLAGWGTIEIPAQIAKLKNLQKLDISGNVVAKISPEIKKLAQLQEIVAHKCPYFDPPSILFELQQLRSLDLSNNEWKNLSSEIGNLVNLIRLDLSGNEFTILPSEIGKLSNLTTLDLSNNQLTNLPVEIGKLINLTLLNLYGNKLNSLPPEIGELASLKKLFLNDNELGYLPPEIGKLFELTLLDLSGNRLKSLPNEIGKLKGLETLSLGATKDDSLTYKNELVVISGYKSLISVSDLDATMVDDFNAKILAAEERLETKLSQRNIFEELPDCIKELNSLKFLDVSFTQLRKIPSFIKTFIQLKVLRAEHNEIYQLPAELQKLIMLEELALFGNPVPIPIEILSNRQPQKILNYYLSITQQKAKPVNELKLIVIGQGSVGKTSLIQQILHSRFDQNQVKTEGISIDQWMVSEDDINYQKFTKHQSNIDALVSPIKIKIWDFGGQEIMHATHQFFLTKRSLYLLVLDARLTQEGNRVEYWLKIIQSFGGESPVLIVGNKTDQHPLDIDRTGLQKKYPNIVGILETSAATGTGIGMLKWNIIQKAKALPHVRDLLPETWFTVKSKLEELGRDKNFITQDEYLSLCRANEVTDETSQHTLIGFLHDLGVVLHFQDDPRLEALGILNPQWVTNGVYKILNSHELFQNQGTLTLPILNKTLIPPEYPSNKRLFIVDMMKKFELCYDIEPDKSFLIPDLLPKDEPFTGEWDSALAFQIHYNVLPSSIITRFIVRMNAFVHKTIWRSGVVLKRGDNTALVKADTEDKKIYIWVNGKEETRRDFLSAIRMEFDAIHKTIAKIEAIEKVPLPNAPDATPIDLNFLQRAASEGRESLPVQVGNRIIDLLVKEVLGQIEKDGKSSSANMVVNIQGNVYGSIGNGNTVNFIQKEFEPIYEAIEASSRDATERQDLIAEVDEIKDEVAKGEQANESFLSRRLRNLKKMAPDIAEVALATLANPTAGVAMVVQKVAKKIKAETK